MKLFLLTIFCCLVLILWTLINLKGEIVSKVLQSRPLKYTANNLTGNLQKFKNNTGKKLTMETLLKCTTLNDVMLETTPPVYLKGLQNPCFALDAQFNNILDINLTTALAKQYHIKCVPGLFLAGFTKCGTSDFFEHLLLLNLHQASEGLYNRKEPHFWDNCLCVQRYTFDKYTDRFPLKNLIGNDVKAKIDAEDFKGLFVDATPRYIWHGDNRQNDHHNFGIVAPEILLPQKIKHIIPSAKFIILLRNPVDRLFSDYVFFFKGEKTVTDFHKKVVDSIGWWNMCIQSYPLLTCMYGPAPGNLPKLSMCTCKNDGQHQGKNNKTDSCKPWADGRNSASRLRIGLYHHYLQNWMNIFPKSSFLVLNFDDYISDQVAIFNNYVCPFIGRSQLTNQEIKKILHRKNSVQIANRGKYKTLKMLDSTRTLLDEFYKQTEDGLVEILGTNKFQWINNN